MASEDVRKIPRPLYHTTSLVNTHTQADSELAKTVSVRNLQGHSISKDDKLYSVYLSGNLLTPTIFLPHLLQLGAR